MSAISTRDILLTLSPTKKVVLRIPLVWDEKVEEWILTKEAHEMIDARKKKFLDEENLAE